MGGTLHQQHPGELHPDPAPFPYELNRSTWPTGLIHPRGHHLFTAHQRPLKPFLPNRPHPSACLDPACHVASHVQQPPILPRCPSLFETSVMLPYISGTNTNPVWELVEQPMIRMSVDSLGKMAPARIHPPRDHGAGSRHTPRIPRNRLNRWMMAVVRLKGTSTHWITQVVAHPRGTQMR